MYGKEIQEISIQPDEIENIDFYYYRVKGSGDLVKRIELQHDGKKYMLYKKQVNQLIRTLGLKYRKLVAMTDWKERNKIISEAIKNSKRIMYVSYDPISMKVVRVVGSKFQYIPHKLVIDTINDVLGESAYEHNVDYYAGMYATWRLEHRTEDYFYRIYARNYNDGHHSLRIGFGMHVITCENLADVPGIPVRIIHTLPEDKVKNRITYAVEEALKNMKLLEPAVEKAKVTVCHDIPKYINSLNLPEHIKEKIRLKVIEKKTETAWDLSNVLSEIGTHDLTLTKNYAENLRIEATKVLDEDYLTKKGISCHVSATA